MAETPLSPDFAPGENAAVDAAPRPSGDVAASHSGDVAASHSDDVAAHAGAEGTVDSTAGDAPWETSGTRSEGSWQQAPADATASASWDSSVSTTEAGAVTEPLDGEPRDSEARAEAVPEPAAPWSPPTPTPPWEPAFSSPEPAPAASPATADPSVEPPLPVEPTAAVEPPVPAAGIATTIAVPPLDAAAGTAGEGGEWELLVGRLNAWFRSGELNRQWQQIRGPLKGVALLIAVILVLRLYATVVGGIDRIPLVSGLLELTGLIALVHFGLTKMVRTSEREQVLATWKQRWQAFLGQD